MHYFEVWIADSKYRGEGALTYRHSQALPALSVVSIPLRNRLVTGFVTGPVPKPKFAVKEVKSVLSPVCIPSHSIELARWLSQYYAVSLGESLRQFAPSAPVIKRRLEPISTEQIQEDLRLEHRLNAEQTSAVAQIKANNSTTILLHGDTGSGKTRVYLELAKETIGRGQSVIMLTPEIGLTAQLINATKEMLNCPVHLLHSEMTPASRKKSWFTILESNEPSVVIGPRSALFAPINNVGLIVVDEAHEAAYKQGQAPHYHAVRVASRLGELTNAKVILGSATPLVTDHYLAKQHSALVKMRLQAASQRPASLDISVVDLREKNNLLKNRYLSDQLIDQISQNLANRKQSLLYYNRRGTARLILCNNCGWQLLCPNCDIPLIYHGDSHAALCHTCGHTAAPPSSCPQCGQTEVIYTSIGTKALTDITAQLFPSARINRFDSDNEKGEKLNELYNKLHTGEIDILIGTQLVAKGLDLPKLGLVGIVSADSPLALPDYTAEERMFQLLYQVIGRVGRHSHGQVIIQTFSPDSFIISAAAQRDYDAFYEKMLAERQSFRFPPFSYLMKLECRRATEKGAIQAASKLKQQLATSGLPVEILGPTPSFHHRRGHNYYYQIVARAKSRRTLLQLAERVPTGWTVDLDPADLL